MKFKSLGSGSTGNATLIEVSRPDGRPLRLLVDCGFGIKQLEQRLGVAELRLDQLDAIFITHEHGDHIGCALTVSERLGVPLWMSRGTHRALGAPVSKGPIHLIKDGDLIDLGGLQITPFTVPHDAKEPLQLTCTNGVFKLGILTDLGHATPHVLAHLAGCHALVLECNHDEDLLALSGYPPFLKQRVSGQHGHLSNNAAAAIASAVNHAGLQLLVAAHLSLENNRPALARQAIMAALTCPEDTVVVADAHTGTPWLSLSAARQAEGSQHVLCGH